MGRGKACQEALSEPLRTSPRPLKDGVFILKKDHFKGFTFFPLLLVSMAPSGPLGPASLSFALYPYRFFPQSVYSSVLKIEVACSSKKLINIY
jgi:hypothetical protein